jgi:hypothetical protein
MNKYRSFQFAWKVGIIFILIIIGIYYLYSSQLGNKPLPLIPMIFLECTFFFILLLFYGLTITLTDEVLKISFGIGVIRKSIKLENIKSTEVVRNPWYYGLGIKFIPNGMLYNVQGLNAVELTFKNERKIVRIGSPECNILKMEIDKRLINKE